MKLEMGKVQSKKLYSVGYIPKLEKFVLVCVVTWVVWYNRYYEITEKEYNSFGSEKLDTLAEILCEQGIRSERFLLSHPLKYCIIFM